MAEWGVGCRRRPGGIFVETKLGAPGVVERCEQVIELCGFDAREFGVETR